MISLSPLRKGDTVTIISIARKISHAEISDAIQQLEAWGLKVLTGNTIDQSYHQFAGTDEDRLRDLHQAILNPEIKAVLFARGGYGTARLLDKIDFNTLNSNPKWLIGYSDITALHNAMLAHGHFPSLHATMPVNFSGNTSESLESMRQFLFGENPKYTLESDPYNRFGRSTGTLCGGNLSILYSLTGTPWLPDFKGKILFLEDLDEYLYHVDRMMANLHLAGILNNLSGLIIGGMTDMHDNEVPLGLDAMEIIRSWVAPYTYPVCYNFPAGHLPDNRALLMGADVIFEVSKGQTLLSFL